MKEPEHIGGINGLKDVYTAADPSMNEGLSSTGIAPKDASKDEVEEILATYVPGYEESARNVSPGIAKPAGNASSDSAGEEHEGVLEMLADMDYAVMAKTKRFASLPSKVNLLAGHKDEFKHPRVIATVKSGDHHE